MLAHGQSVNMKGKDRFFDLGVNITKFTENYEDCIYRARYAVAHLVEALRYKPEGSGFDSQ